MASSSNKLDEILTKSTLIEGISVSKGEIHGADMHALKQLGYDALQRGENTVVVLGSRLIEDGKVFLMVAITDDVIQSKNLKAGALVGKLGRLVGGGGGGQPNLATAGGKNPEKLDDALSMVDSIIIESI